MKSFCKQHSCPTSAEILSCVKGSITPLAKLRVEQHAKLCDFCGAEMQLLAKHSSVRAHRKLARRPALISFLHISLPVPRVAVAHHAHAA